MARRCGLCGKGTISGCAVSKSMHHCKRVWKPNLLAVRVVVDGSALNMRICAHCLRSNPLMKKAQPRANAPLRAAAPKL